MAPVHRIVLRDMRFNAPIGADSWGRPAKPTTPVTMTVSASVFMANGEGLSDTDVVSVDYSELASTILSVTKSPMATTVDPTARSDLDVIPKCHRYLAEVIFEKWPAIQELEFETKQDLGLYGAATQAEWKSIIPHTSAHRAWVTLRNIRASTIIGLRAHERLVSQTVLASLRLRLIDPEVQSDVNPAIQLTMLMVTAVQKTSFETVEGLVSHLVEECRKFLRDPSYGALNAVTRLEWIGCWKTDALQFVAGAGAEIDFGSG